MAGDWIKVRVWIAKDPKVIAMADWLAVDRAFMDWLGDPVRRRYERTCYEGVTRNVTCYICVTGLIQVWGIANEQGTQDGDDVLMRHASIEHLDEIAGIPSFGAAMEFVGWAKSEDDRVVRLPKFLVHNIPVEDRTRSSNAERQRRYRENQALRSNVTRNATRNVTKRNKSNATEHNNTEQYKNTDPPIVPQTDAAQIYAAYPKKLDRAKALKAIEAALTKVSASELLSAVQEFARCVDGADMQFVKYPATWFNAESWNDDRTQWKRIGRDGKRSEPRKDSGTTYDPEAPPSKF